MKRVERKFEKPRGRSGSVGPRVGTNISLVGGGESETRVGFESGESNESVSDSKDSSCAKEAREANWMYEGVGERGIARGDGIPAVGVETERKGVEGLRRRASG